MVESIIQCGPKFGYNPETSKCWLVVKSQLVKEDGKLFENTKININVNGKQHLGAIIEYKNSFNVTKDLRNNILQQQHEYTDDHDNKTAKNMIKQQR